MLFINKMFYCCDLKIKFNMKMLIFNSFLLLLRTESEEWTYFITVNKYRFCISVIGT